MIDFRFDEQRRILLVTFAVPGTRENFELLDELFKKFVERFGTAHTIIDFSVQPLGVIDTDTLVRRAQRPSRMPGRRRIFVAASDHVFGMMRLYGAHQEVAGEKVPTVVRSLDEGLALLDVPLDQLKPVSV